MRPRRNSDETLRTLNDQENTTDSPTQTGDFDDTASLLSFGSDETLTDARINVFGHHLLSYTRIRELPIVGGLLKSEVVLYPSIKAIKDGVSPIFCVQSNKFHFLMKNAPLLTVQKRGSDFCKVYFKILSNNLTCYVLFFSDGQKVFLFNNALKPCSDAIFNNTKLRIVGASGAASTFGNGLIKIFALADESPSLADGFIVPHDAATIKDVRFRFSDNPPLYTAVTKQHKTVVLNLLAQAVPIVKIPVASYLDHGKNRVNGVRLDGSVRLFESTDDCFGADGDNDENDLPGGSSVLCCLLLVLIEQEIRKMRGHNKPSYVRGPD